MMSYEWKGRVLFYYSFDFDCCQAHVPELPAAGRRSAEGDRAGRPTRGGQTGNQERAGERQRSARPERTGQSPTRFVAVVVAVAVAAVVVVVVVERRRVLLGFTGFS